MNILSRPYYGIQMPGLEFLIGISIIKHLNYRLHFLVSEHFKNVWKVFAHYLIKGGKSTHRPTDRLLLTHV